MEFVNGVPTTLWNQLSKENQDFYTKSGATSLYNLDRGLGASVLLGGGADKLNAAFDALRAPEKPTAKIADVKAGIVAGPVTNTASQIESIMNDYKARQSVADAINAREVVASGGVSILNQFSDPATSATLRKPAAVVTDSSRDVLNQLVTVDPMEYRNAVTLTEGMNAMNSPESKTPAINNPSISQKLTTDQMVLFGAVALVAVLVLFPGAPIKGGK